MWANSQVSLTDYSTSYLMSHNSNSYFQLSKLKRAKTSALPLYIDCVLKGTFPQFKLDLETGLVHSNWFDFSELVEAKYRNYCMYSTLLVVAMNTSRLTFQ